MDYDTQMKLKTQGGKAGGAILVVVVRVLADAVNWTLKFIIEMARSIVGK